MKHLPYRKLKGAIRSVGKTYLDISQLLGISIATVSAKINGQSDFYVSEVEKLKDAYNLSDEIFLP